MEIYAVIDTNVLVSALLSRFKNTSTVQLMQHLILGDITPIYNDEILEEYYSVLTRPKFNFPESLIDETLDVVKKFGINSSRQETEELLPDPKDIVLIYECEIRCPDGRSCGIVEIKLCDRRCRLNPGYIVVLSQYFTELICSMEEIWWLRQ